MIKSDTIATYDIVLQATTIPLQTRRTCSVKNSVEEPDFSMVFAQLSALANRGKSETKTFPLAEQQA
jgi:hypothetical protein